MRVMTGTGDGAWYAMSNIDSEMDMTTRNWRATSFGEPESDPRICRSLESDPAGFWIENMWNGPRSPHRAPELNVLFTYPQNSE